MTTLFEAVGGGEDVLRLAEAWHEHVLADDIVAHAFSYGYHPQHTERLAAYHEVRTLFRMSCASLTGHGTASNHLYPGEL